jgi:hypothetical protein
MSLRTVRQALRAWTAFKNKSLLFGEITLDNGRKQQIVFERLLNTDDLLPLQMKL